MLGEEIKKDERIIRLETARKAYEADTKIGELMVEYNVQQTALREEYAKPDKDNDAIGAIQTRIEEIYNDITTNSNFVALNDAQEEVNRFMNEVNSEITYHITGERPCTHDCSSCGAECSHNH